MDSNGKRVVRTGGEVSEASKSAWSRRALGCGR